MLKLFEEARVMLRGMVTLLALLCLCLHAFPGFALHCGESEFPQCSARSDQFHRSFEGNRAFGGFGGGDCRATRTPVIFVHGNADSAIGWDSLAGGSAMRSSRSVYEELRARGYTDCELFGISYLSASERRRPALNYHRPEKYRIILGFVDDVKAYTGMRQVDVVAHSMGVSMTLAALTWAGSERNANAWTDVRRFINIAGALRGLSGCFAAGPGNPLVPTCGSQNLLNRYVFGFHPDTGSWPGRNAWTSERGAYSLRLMPRAQPSVLFYTIHAGEHDQVLCSATSIRDGCAKSALFAPGANVRAQLDVGTGSTATHIDLDFRDDSPFLRRGGDADGVGHYNARNTAGGTIWRMLNSECRGARCAGALE